MSQKVADVLIQEECLNPSLIQNMGQFGGDNFCDRAASGDCRIVAIMVVVSGVPHVVVEPQRLLRSSSST